MVLGFLRSAFLIEPLHQLRGEAEAKPAPPITDFTDLHPSAVADLIPAAVAHDPTA